jgi:hypothetical protein
VTPARALGLASLLFATLAQAAGARAPSPPLPWPAPPVLPLIRVEVAHDHVLVSTDVLLHRGDWTSGDMDGFVSFGAPGVPRAIDARLYRGDGEASAAEQEAGFTPLRVERAYRRGAPSHLLLGTSTMAGAVLHIPAAVFDHATRESGVTRLRVRTLMDAPPLDVTTGREVVVRLGQNHGEPDALETIEVVGAEASLKIVRAEARLCGPDADPHPLAVRVLPAIPTPRLPQVDMSDPLAPGLSVRHASDDLCIRYWTAGGG